MALSIVKVTMQPPTTWWRYCVSCLTSSEQQKKIDIQLGSDGEVFKEEK